MKKPIEAMQIRIAVKEGGLIQSQVLREIRNGYEKLSPTDKDVIHREANSIRKQVANYLTREGSEELLAKLGMFLIDKGV